MRIMTLGCGLKDTQEGSGVAGNTMKQFFHPWCAWFVEQYWDEWVWWPTTEEEIRDIEAVYAKLGLPGCVSSMDAVHLAWDNSPAKYRSSNAGKEKYPTLAFNCHAAHNRRILAVNGPYNGARNDKSLVKLDRFVMAVKTLALFTSYQFSVLRSASTEKVIRGAWILCDGGYHRWRCTISGYSPPGDAAKAAWTKR